MATIMSAFLTVESLCATMMVVLPRSRLSRASCTRASLSLSRAEVASSRRRICGFLISARAMAILCFWPPDSWAPPSPTIVSRPCGSLEIKS